MAVVVAQLVERSLPIPEVRSSNPVYGKFYAYLLERRKNKKRPGMVHFLETDDKDEREREKERQCENQLKRQKKLFVSWKTF